MSGKQAHSSIKTDKIVLHSKVCNSVSDPTKASGTEMTSFCKTNDFENDGYKANLTNKSWNVTCTSIFA